MKLEFGCRIESSGLVFFSLCCSRNITNIREDVYFSYTFPNRREEERTLTAGSWSGSARSPADLSWLSVGGFQPRALSASGPPAGRGEQRSPPSPWQQRGHRVAVPIYLALLQEGGDGVCVCKLGRLWRVDLWGRERSP